MVVPEYRIADIFSPRVPLREVLAGVVEHLIATNRGHGSAKRFERDVGDEGRHEAVKDSAREWVSFHCASKR